MSELIVGDDTNTNDDDTSDSNARFFVRKVFERAPRRTYILDCSTGHAIRKPG